MSDVNGSSRDTVSVKRDIGVLLEEELPWDGERTIFLEAKRQKRGTIRDTQWRWVEGTLSISWTEAI